MKRFLSIFLLVFSFSLLFGQEYKKLFLKGNIYEKTVSVREATGADGIWISNQAINFIIENQDILQNDRDIDGLALAAVLSIQNDYVSTLPQNKKDELLNKLVELFKIFNNSNTVQTAVQSKILSLKNILDTTSFTKVMNEYIQNPFNMQNDPSMIRSVILTLGAIGDNVSFSILYNYLNDRRYINYQNELEESVVNLIPISVDEVLQIVHSKDVTQLYKILNLTKKNQQIPQNLLCEIAENVLNETIILIGNSSEKNQLLVELQLDSLNILDTNKWTRASSSVLKFFNSAKSEYGIGLFTENQMGIIIQTLPNIAPIKATMPLISYLEELNQQVENNVSVNESVVLALINTLGSIGDKQAFDALLSVTYLSYSETVLSAARKALAGLRW